ncbi:MAG: hypothetical protein L3K03_02340 [Thermoplasmata archaeon]|nr:hypothetical protein [Thermoplasmata archaeon]
MSVGPPTRWVRPAIVGPGLLAVVSIGLALEARIGLGLGLGVALGGVVLWVVVRRLPIPYAGLVALLGALTSLGALVSWVPDTLSSDLLAGIGGITLLLSMVEGADSPSDWGDATNALAVPVLAVVVAFLTRAAVPLGTANIGDAGLLLVILLLGGAFLYRDPTWLGSPTS